MSLLHPVWLFLKQSLCWFTHSSETVVAVSSLVPDIHEEILIRLDVKDLIRYKSVCKSWRSLISSTRFIKTHLYYNDNAIGDTRIVMYPSPSLPFNLVMDDDSYHHYYVVGSCNGLVCISDLLWGRQLYVANPLTRELKQLKSPENPWINTPSTVVCWGFGYDSDTDDYKVIAGFKKSLNGATISFQMITSKSNVWIDIGEVDHVFSISNIGTLCNGSLHWLMTDLNKNEKILTFHMSKEEFEFKQIRLPDDVKWHDGLGVIKGCLCICDDHYKIWVLNNDDVKQPWKLITNEIEINYVVHYFRMWNNLPYNPTFYNNGVFSSMSDSYITYPIFVQSLVSPHVKEDTVI